MDYGENMEPFEFDRLSWVCAVRVLDGNGKCWYQFKYLGPRARYISEWATFISREHHVESERTIDPRRRVYNLAFIYDGPDVTAFVDFIRSIAHRWVEHGAAGQSIGHMVDGTYLESRQRH